MNNIEHAMRLFPRMMNDERSRHIRDRQARWFAKKYKSDSSGNKAAKKKWQEKFWVFRDGFKRGQHFYKWWEPWEIDLIKQPIYSSAQLAPVLKRSAKSIVRKRARMDISIFESLMKHMGYKKSGGGDVRNRKRGIGCKTEDTKKRKVSEVQKEA